MARTDSDQPMLLSVIDRLIDDDPDASRDPRRSRSQHLAELRRAVGRDLETLLNTRRRCLSWPDDLAELDVSLINYGLADFTGANLASSDARNEFQEQIENTIRKFEPRFKSVKVTLLDNAEPLDRTLRFRIEALIHAEPAPEPLIYDSVVEPVTRNFSVASAR